jgi:lipopolysaccharide transport system permease protein
MDQMLEQTLTLKPEQSRTIIEPRTNLFDLSLKELWGYRELLYSLALRDVKVRYKQTVLGVTWVVLQPLITMLIFTVLFSYLTKMPSDGAWYPVFVYTALLPWTYFAQAIGRSGGSLVSNASMISKVYFPRLILPLASILGPLLDFALSFIILLAMVFWVGTALTWKIVTLPLFLGLAFMMALGVSLFISAANVRYRDVGHTIPFLMQIWMFASPVVYPVSAVPDHWRFLYSLNPMVGVIEGFRWALLGSARPDFVVMAVSVAAILAFLFGGVVYFKHMERTFADVI